MVEGLGDAFPVARQGAIDAVVGLGRRLRLRDAVQLVLRQAGGELARRAVIPKADLDHAERPQIRIDAVALAYDHPGDAFDRREHQPRADRICLAWKVGGGWSLRNHRRLTRRRQPALDDGPRHLFRGEGDLALEQQVVNDLQVAFQHLESIPVDWAGKLRGQRYAVQSVQTRARIILQAMSPSGQPPVAIVSDLSRAPAEILRGLLEAQGISVALSQEAAGAGMPVDVGAFGQVEILVAAEQAARAREILDELDRQPPLSDEG